MNDSFNDKHKLHLYSLMAMQPWSIVDIDDLGDRRESHYNGIIPEVAATMEYYFAEGEDDVRNKLLATFRDAEEGNGISISEGFWLFRTKDHVAYLNQAMCEKVVADEFSANVIDLITEYSHQQKDYYYVADCMDASPDDNMKGGFYYGSPRYNQLHGNKYYRYALSKDYVRDFRMEKLQGKSSDLEQEKRTGLFSRLGDLALIHEADAGIIQQSGIEAAKEFIALGQEQMRNTLLMQYDHCGTIGCSTPEWEGTLFATGLMDNKNFVLEYIQLDRHFTYDLTQNSYYYLVAGDEIIANQMVKIMLAKPLGEEIHTEYLRKKMLLGNVDEDYPLYIGYNPYHVRHKKLQFLLSR